MSRRILVRAMCFMLVALGAYWAGTLKGRADTEKIFMVAMENSNVHGSVANFLIATKAVQRIRASEPGDADRILLKYAQLQLPLLEQCTKSPSCVAWNGRFMPSQQERERIAQLKPFEPK